jgi:hypothetical protein
MEAPEVSPKSSPHVTSGAQSGGPQRATSGVPATTPGVEIAASAGASGAGLASPR